MSENKDKIITKEQFNVSCFTQLQETVAGPMVTAFQSVPVVKISRDSETKKCPDFSLEPGNVKPLEQRRERAPDNGHGHTARPGQGGPRELDLGDMGEITRQQREQRESTALSIRPSADRAVILCYILCSS